MKRYKLKCGYCDSCGATFWNEDPQGEWVRYEDVAKQIERAFDTGKRAAQAEHREHTTPPCVFFSHPSPQCSWVEAMWRHYDHDPQCNCDEMATWARKTHDHDPYWICPTHGYKRR